MDKETYHITKEGKEKLDQELEHLVKVERENVKVAIAEARAHGDLKENSEYHSAKEKQSHIEGRILELQHKLAHAKVVDVKELNSEKVVFGATVTLFDCEKETSIKYKIVGIDEADSSKGKISYTSPIAKALLGKEEEEEVTVKAPKGDVEYVIEKIEYV